MHNLSASSYFLDRNTGTTTWEDPRGYPQARGGMSTGAKVAVGLAGGVALAGLSALAVHEYDEHEEEERDRQLEDELAYERNNTYNTYGENYGDGTTVVIEGNDNFDYDETIVQKGTKTRPNNSIDGYGDTTVIQRDDGWFGDDTTVTTTDAYGDTTVVEEDDDWF
ncbi:hypothetical protein DFQ30_006842 [Apophysomyces sp. BC1015]|nr:hypothetical protein DFQ30_006842 [Apophysomyces sp. BC1015]